MGKKICADYISAWHTGIVKYYNRQLDKYLLAFDDGSSDLISEEDIDYVLSFCSGSFFDGEDSDFSMI